jgi:uncharacterized protein DUF3822
VNYHVIESEFNKKLSTAYQLSILVGMDSLVYFVSEAEKQHGLLLKTFSFDAPDEGVLDLAAALKGVFEKDELLNILYRRVKIALPHTPAALVPNRLYNPAEKTTYLEELTQVDDPGSIEVDELPELAARVVYPSANGLVSLLKRQFPTGRYYSPATPFLRGCNTMLAEGAGHSVFAHFWNNGLYVSVFEKDSLHFFNAFSIASASDALYYILLAFNQFKLDPNDVPLHLSGQIVQDSEIFKMLYRYITRIRFLSELPFMNFSKKYEDIPQHFFFNLYALSLCK